MTPADAVLMFRAYQRLNRCDPATGHSGTVAEALERRLFDAGYRFSYLGDEMILSNTKGEKLT